MQCRNIALAAVLAASADAFGTPALSGLRMQTSDAAVSRKQALQSAGAVAAGVLAAPQFAGAAGLDIKTGFPTGSCLPGSSNAGSGCSPMTNVASVLDKQRAVLAGKITVNANKIDQLNAAVAAMKVEPLSEATMQHAILLHCICFIPCYRILF